MSPSVTGRKVLKMPGERVPAAFFGESAEFLGGSELFPEFAETLLWFVARLHRALLADSVDQVFFLSREGQPLMRAFELYQTNVEKKIIPRYLEVSRRSTLLPSLSSLAGETFDTLFRQYREISFYEFLASLGLESRLSELTELLGISDEDARVRCTDFPTSDLFLQLLGSSKFQLIYESERVARKNAFMAYLATLAGGSMPTRLALVDVGWKGTIQDNLHSLLCVGDGAQVCSIKGYYVGLVGAGRMCEGNEKTGLLFSSVGGRSPHFHIFNENRALFEILLAADHGSIESYQTDDSGVAKPVRGTFEEQDMIERFVLPVQRSIFARFSTLLASLGGRRLSSKDVARTHSRMVFRPSVEELRWFASVFHVENFGVFERSEFKSSRRRLSAWGRLCFLAHVARHSGRGTLGFWPWQTLYDSAGYLPAFVYGALRRMQR